MCIGNNKILNCVELHIMSFKHSNYFLLILIFVLASCKASEDPLKALKHRTVKSKSTERRSKRAARKEDKIKWKEDRETKMRSEKMVRDHHRRIQTKGTQESMRENRRKSESIRKNKLY